MFEKNSAPDPAHIISRDECFRNFEVMVFKVGLCFPGFVFSINLFGKNKVVNSGFYIIEVAEE
jgi:hypothetical protein